MLPKPAALIFLAMVMIVTAGCGDKASSSPGAAPAKQPPAAGDKFVIAGSGSNIPAMKKLADAYFEKTGQKVEVPPSIGSVGAINAVQAGGLELGLISQPLTAEAKNSGLKELPYGRVAVVFAAHPSAPDRGFTAAEIVDILKGSRTTWSDGSKMFVFVREANDSSNLVLCEAIPGYKRALSESYEQNRWQILYRDAEMAAMLQKIRGGIGVVSGSDIAAANGLLKPLDFDGAAPTQENIQTGRYRLFKELAFVYKGLLTERSAKFVDFVFSEEGRRISEEHHSISIGR